MKEKRNRLAPLLEEIVFLDMARTVELLSARASLLLKTADLSPAQYNVLRILRGSSPEGLTCSEIGNRMITRDSDITRLLDRLEKRGLVSRNRNDKDRRIVLTCITAEGLDLLESLDEPVRNMHRKQMGHLGRKRLEALAEILEDCRTGLD